MSEMNKLFVCGAGTGDPAQVTPEVSAAIAGARAVACAPRHLHLVREHGNIIEMTDFKECFAKLRKELALGDAAYKTVVNSTKSMTGHLLGAAGAIEGLACIMAITKGIVPPTINVENLDPKIDPKINLTLNKAQKRDVKYALSNTFGFGGHNSTVIFKKI